MENAIWNGKIYTATEISESYELEKDIRKASGRKELICPDPDCHSPILRYCHGEIKNAFFAHRDNCACDYAQFDKGNTQLIRQVKSILYNSFSEKGFDVKIEVKILPRHYTDLLFTMPDKKKIAVELGTQATTASKIEYLTKAYSDIGVEIKWIVISNSNTPIKENKTFFIKRYLLNESKNKDLLILNLSGTEITQYVLDPNEYLFKGKVFSSKNYPDFYCEKVPLSSLTIEDNEITISGFHLRYKDWLAKKKRAFNKKTEQLEEHLKQRESENREFRKMFSREKIEIVDPLYNNKHKETTRIIENTATTISYDERRQSILSVIDQQKKPVKDEFGKRWIRCEKCGAVETEEKFWTYGGENHVNLGTCYECTKREDVQDKR